MTQAISGGSTSAVTELAMLLVEIDSNQAETDKASRQEARQSYLEHAREQVDALLSAANETMNGALVGAAFSVAGGALSVAGAVSQYDADMSNAAASSLKADRFAQCSPTYAQSLRSFETAAAGATEDANILNASGKTLSALAAPAQSFADAAAQRFRAAAKNEEVLGEQAKWEAGDASTSADKADKQIDKFLDLLQGIQRDQNSANNAIIGRI
jgi:hypothetical protein